MRANTTYSQEPEIWSFKVLGYTRLGLGLMILALVLQPYRVRAATTNASAAILKVLMARSTFGATIHTEWAVETREGRTQKVETIIKPELELELPWDLKLTAIGRLSGDVVDLIEPGMPNQPEIRSIR